MSYFSNLFQTYDPSAYVSARDDLLMERENPDLKNGVSGAGRYGYRGVAATIGYGYDISTKPDGASILAAFSAANTILSGLGKDEIVLSSTLVDLLNNYAPNAEPEGTTSFASLNSQFNAEFGGGNPGLSQDQAKALLYAVIPQYDNLVSERASTVSNNYDLTIGYSALHIFLLSEDYNGGRIFGPKQALAISQDNVTAFLENVLFENNVGSLTGSPEDKKYLPGLENRRVKDLASSLGMTTSSLSGTSLVTLNFSGNALAAIQVYQALYQNQDEIADKIADLVGKYPTAHAGDLTTLNTSLLNNARDAVNTSSSTGYYLVQSGDTPTSIATHFSIDATTLEKLNRVFNDDSYEEGGLVHGPASAANIGLTPTSLPSISSNLTYVFSPADGKAYKVGAALDGHTNGALIIEPPDSASTIRRSSLPSIFDAGTYGDISYDSTSQSTTVAIVDASHNPIGYLTVDSTGASNLFDASNSSLTDFPAGELLIKHSSDGGVDITAYTDALCYEVHLTGTGFSGPTTQSISYFTNDYDIISSFWEPTLKSVFSSVFTDPLVLDLSSGGTGVELSALADSSAYFDLNKSGFAVHTGWVGPTTGFLARDNNNNGSIDDITELFGDSTVNGFTALKALDTNNDNKITSADSTWSGLKVWTDANGDGVTDSGELQSLSALNITEISLNSAETTQEVNGNIIGAVATFKRSDDSTGQVAEAFFNNSQMDSQFAGSYTFDPDVLSLPNLRGYGTVPDLYIAMSMDATLKGMVRGLANTDPTDVASFDSQVKAILYRWAGVDDVDPTSRGGYVNGQDLDALESFMGQQYRIPTTSNLPVGWDPTDPISYHQGNNLEAAWGIVFNVMKAQLLAQGPLASLFEGVSFDYNSGRLTAADLSDAATNLVDSLPTDRSTAIRLLAYYTPLLNDVAEDAGVAKSGYNTILQDAFSDLGFSFSTATIDAFASTDTSGDPMLGGEVTGTGDHILYLPSASNVQLSDSSSGNDLLIAGDGRSPLLTAGAGNDVLIAGNGYDARLYAGAGNDLLISGDGDHDEFYAGTGTTTIIAGNGNNLFTGSTGTLILSAGSGDDTIHLNHTLGAGSSISGGDGTDTLLLEQSVQGVIDLSGTEISGIENIGIVHAVMTGDQLDGVESVQSLVSGARIDTASAGTYSLAGKGTARIDLFAMTDNVNLIGNGASGEQLSANWVSHSTFSAGDGGGVIINTGTGSSNTFVGGSGATTFVMEKDNQSGNTFTGGSGADTIQYQYYVDLTGATISGIETLQTGQARLTQSEFSGFSSLLTNKVYAATSGTYSLVGKASGRVDLSADTNAGVTLIANDAAGEVLTASASGTDTLVAGGGDGQVLNAGGGTSTLTGGSGNNQVFNGSTGTFHMQGGNGNATFVLSGTAGAGSTIVAGTGNDTLYLTNDNANYSNLTFSGIETLRFNHAALSSDQFNVFSSFVTTNGNGRIDALTAGTYSIAGKSTARIDLFAMTNSVNLIGNDANGEQLYANWVSSSTFAAGNGSGVVINTGTGSSNTFAGGSGSTTFVMEKGDQSGNTFTGGSGADTIQYQYYVDLTGATVSGIETLQTGQARLTQSEFSGFSSLQTNVIYAATSGTYSLVGKTSSRIDLTADTNAGVTLIANDATNEILTASASGTDTLIAGGGNGQKLYGGSGNNTLVAGTGTATLQGGGGTDSYQFGDGFTQDTVVNNGGGTAKGEIDFSALASSDLWFKQVGNDLEIDAIGTSNKVTVAGWYNSDSAKVASIHTDDSLVLDSQLASLVSAMATYLANNPAFNPATATAMPTDTTLQSALAASWHA